MVRNSQFTGAKVRKASQCRPQLSLPAEFIGYELFSMLGKPL
jgi:hypothetical protein